MHISINVILQSAKFNHNPSCLSLGVTDNALTNKGVKNNYVFTSIFSAKLSKVKFPTIMKSNISSNFFKIIHIV